jgi:hypothetical protein
LGWLGFETSMVMVGCNDECKRVVCIEKIHIIPRCNLEFILIFNENTLGCIGNIDSVPLIPNLDF